MDSSLASLLAGAGVAGVWVICFVLGLVYPKSVVNDLKAEIAELKAALKARTDAADAATTAAMATRDILSAIQLGRDIGHEHTGP